MISFAFVDQDGIPTRGGRNHQVPEGAIVLPNPYTFADLGRIRWQGGAWVEIADPKAEVQPPEVVAAQAASVIIRARAQAVDRVNAAAGRLRARIYTDIPGQDAMYLEKRAEAVAYVRQASASGEPETLQDYPLLQNEVGVTAATPWQLAQIWLHRSDEFKAIGAATERARMQAIIALAMAEDEDAITRLEAEFYEALTGLPI